MWKLNEIFSLAKTKLIDVVKELSNKKAKKLIAEEMKKAPKESLENILGPGCSLRKRRHKNPLAESLEVGKPTKKVYEKPVVSVTNRNNLKI